MSATTTLAGTELRLMTREWAVLAFAFAFPVLLMLILGGVFGSTPSPEYGDVTPDAYYVADYVAVPLGALSLIGLPVMVATYRENGVLLRLRAAGVPTTSVLGAQAMVTGVLVLAGAAAVLASAAPVYGVPAVHEPLQVVAGYLLGAIVMVSLGLVLGLSARTGRSAQAIGLLVFFPMWLLGAGGPPRAVMPPSMGAVADVLPLGRVAAAVREPWLGTGSPRDDLLVLLIWAVGTAAVLGVLVRRGQ